MSASPSTSALLQAAQARFIQGGVSVNVASSSAERVPSVARAVGCSVSRNRRQVTVYLRRSQSWALLEDLQRCRAVAAVFCQPSTHRTLQLKGTDAAIHVPAKLNARAIRAQAEAFHSELEGFGYRREWTLTMLGYEPQDIVAVTFTPTAVFEQTPGPKAGERLA